MKFQHCALHRGTDRDLPCLRIRHDDGRVATESEVWAEIEAQRELLRLVRLERDELAAKVYAEARADEDAALWEERARHLGWRELGHPV